MELRIPLQPKQREALKKSEITPVTFYGGAKGGGKSYFIRAREMLRRFKFKGTKGLIVRKTYPELLSNHIRKFFEEYPQTKDWFNKSEKTIYWPGGSTTEFSYLQNPDDVFTYQGREYEDISIDEITQHEENVFKILRSSNRTANKSFRELGGRPTMILTGNPGGIGNTWVRRIFVEKSFTEKEKPSDFDFIQAFVSDNTALTKYDPDYKRRLEDLPDHLRKAYLEGDWYVFAGQAFSELTTQSHIVEPFELPSFTRYFAGYDHGYNHPFAFVLWAIVPDGNIYCVSYITGRLKQVTDINEEINELIGDKKVDIYAGHDIFSKQKDGTPSIDEQFMDLGIVMLKANINRKLGVSYMRKLFNHSKGTSQVRFFSNTIPVYNNIASMQFSQRDPEDVLKVDADENGEGGDDLYDAGRYGLTSRMQPIKIADKPAIGTGRYVLDQLKLERERIGGDSYY